MGSNGKVNDMQEKMGNVSRVMKTLKKNKKKMLKIKIKRMFLMGSVIDWI